MIRRCDDRDFELILAIINDGAQAYKGIIPSHRWTEPYMSAEKLQHEIDDGVVFWGCEETGTLEGVMGLQQVQDVTLIRHAYVRTSSQKRGIGARLLSHLGDPLLRKIRLSTGESPGEEPAAQEILDHPRTPDRNIRGSGGSDVARLSAFREVAEGSSD
jgi:GNAT superfamily N-acetyltransferase